MTTFNHLPQGDYAVAVYHDENDNGRWILVSQAFQQKASVMTNASSLLPWHPRRLDDGICRPGCSGLHPEMGFLSEDFARCAEAMIRFGRWIR
jgi:acetyl/propionyl-CoA carboxylase alpha subunit